MNVLIINALLYAFWFLFVLNKERKLTIYSFLILFYLCIAFIGVYSVSTSIYYNTFGFYSLKNLEIEPYVYSFITYFILFLQFPAGFKPLHP